MAAIRENWEKSADGILGGILAQVDHSVGAGRPTTIRRSWLYASSRSAPALLVSVLRPQARQRCARWLERFAKYRRRSIQMLQGLTAPVAVRQTAGGVTFYPDPGLLWTGESL